MPHPRCAHNNRIQVMMTSHYKGRYPEPPKGILEPCERVEKEWEANPASVCRDMVDSMPRRVAVVIAAREGYMEC